MPSPFPGMDPFIEMQEWEDFHASFVVDLADALSPLVQPRYVARVQRRIYAEQMHDDDPDVVDASVAILRGNDARQSELHAVAGRSGAAIAPVPIRLRMPRTEPRRESYLIIRERQTREVVTVIELLSPSNKRADGDGRRLYLKKRRLVLNSATHLVELDLLRGGRRLPTEDPLPNGDYFVFVSRAKLRPEAEVYAWTLRDPLPRIAVPLRDQEPPVSVDLQTLFNARYDRAGYGVSLDYTAPLRPRTSPEDAEWIAERLASRAVIRRD